MRGILVSLLIISGIVFLLNCAKTSNGQNQTSNCQCVTDALSEIGKIKVGMKRKDLVEIARNDGGISPNNPQRFVYKKCNYIKVQVKFKSVNESERFPEGNPEDEIDEISKPYLEHPFYD
jgi:hypothetical protein